MSAISLYAELLPNLRQLNVFVSLPTAWNDHTKVGLSIDGTKIWVVHDRQTATVDLPLQVNGRTDLPIPAVKTKQLSFRLQAENDAALESAICSSDCDEDAPWPASSLTVETQFGCKNCKSTILLHSIKNWVSLPSDDWAEMMEFWHCHKPDVDGSIALATGTKEFRASTQRGLVDPCHLVLEQSDCCNTKFEASDQASVHCGSCQSTIGTVDVDLGGLRLNKANLSMRLGDKAQWEQYASQIFTSANLLRLIRGQFIRKFIVHSGKIETCIDVMLLWVLNLDILYCSSFREGEVKRAMKVLFRSSKEVDRKGSANGTTFEELNLPSRVMQELREDLEASNRMLPDEAQVFQGWRTGLLDRYPTVAVAGRRDEPFPTKAL